MYIELYRDSSLMPTCLSSLGTLRFTFFMVIGMKWTFIFFILFFHSTFLLTYLFFLLQHREEFSYHIRFRLWFVNGILKILLLYSIEVGLFSFIFFNLENYNRWEYFILLIWFKQIFKFDWIFFLNLLYFVKNKKK